MDLHKVFNLTVPVERAVKRFRGMKTVKERGVHHVQDAVAEVQRVPHDVKLDEYSEYFQHVTDDIRKEFTFRPRIMSQVDAFFSDQNISRTGIVKVGIHIRCKQLNTTQRIKMGYRPPTAEYYSKAMKYFQDKYSNVYFILCSDDIKWACKNIFWAII